MKRAAVMIALIASACAKKAPETTYPMTATVIARDVRGNTVNLRNENIPGVMEPMDMDYPLRGAKADSLPPNGTPVTATLHRRDDEFWVTDVKAKK